MGKRYLVVDQNVLRKPFLADMVRAQPDIRYVLPDLAFMEMTKTPQWESTLHNSLAVLSTVPSRVNVTISINEALGQELRTTKPSIGHLISPNATAFVRDILESVRTGTDGWALSRIRLNPEYHLETLARDHLQHEENKKLLIELRDATRTKVPPEVQKRMRQKKLSDEERLDLLHQIGTSLAVPVVSSQGITEANARAFLRKKPMVFRYLLLKVWRSLFWIENGGAESFVPSAATNEEIDDQYILTATAFDGLLSEEKSANLAFKALEKALSRKLARARSAQDPAPAAGLKNAPI